MNLTLRNWYESKTKRDSKSIKADVMAACFWSEHTWGNKLQGKSSLTDLEKVQIVEIEKKYRICNEIGINYSNADLMAGFENTEAMQKLVEKYKELGIDDVFGRSKATSSEGAEVGSLSDLV